MDKATHIDPEYGNRHTTGLITRKEIYASRHRSTSHSKNRARWMPRQSNSKSSWSSCRVAWSSRQKPRQSYCRQSGPGPALVGCGTALSARRLWRNARTYIPLFARALVLVYVLIDVARLLRADQADPVFEEDATIEDPYGVGHMDSGVDALLSAGVTIAGLLSAAAFVAMKFETCSTIGIALFVLLRSAQQLMDRAGRRVPLLGQCVFVLTSVGFLKMVGKRRQIRPSVQERGYNRGVTPIPVPHTVRPLDVVELLARLQASLVLLDYCFATNKHIGLWICFLSMLAALTLGAGYCVSASCWATMFSLIWLSVINLESYFLEFEFRHALVCTANLLMLTRVGPGVISVDDGMDSSDRLMY